jgi:Acyl-CoA dehydrogenase, C-terminal domain
MKLEGSQASVLICYNDIIATACQSNTHLDYFAKAVDWSMRTVDRLMGASGGRGIFLSNPIQRAWRDIHAMRARIGNSPERAAAVFGRSEFGLPPVDIRF